MKKTNERIERVMTERMLLHLVNLKLINPENDVMFIADNGLVIRMKAQEISKIGRDTLGVRIMKFKESGKVVCIAESPAGSEEMEGEE